MKVKDLKGTLGNVDGELDIVLLVKDAEHGWLTPQPVTEVFISQHVDYLFIAGGDA